MKTILIASDHAGFELKQALIPYIQDMGFDVKDFGAHEFLEDDDYPDYIAPLAKEISENDGIQQAIVIGGSGQGEAMVANRVPGVRCAVFYGPKSPITAVDVTGRLSQDDYEIVRLSRMHNNANVLSLGARFLNLDDAKKAINIFLGTIYVEEERLERRIEKIDK